MYVSCMYVYVYIHTYIHIILYITNLSGLLCLLKACYASMGQKCVIRVAGPWERCQDKQKTWVK